MDRTTITDAIFDACVQLLRAERTELRPTTHFAEDLEADSLDLAEIVMSLEDRFGVSIDDDDLEGVHTIADAVEMVLRVHGDA